MIGRAGQPRLALPGEPDDEGNRGWRYRGDTGAATETCPEVRFPHVKGRAA